MQPLGVSLPAAVWARTEGGTLTVLLHDAADDVEDDAKDGAVFGVRTNEDADPAKRATANTTRFNEKFIVVLCGPENEGVTAHRWREVNSSGAAAAACTRHSSAGGDGGIEAPRHDWVASTYVRIHRCKSADPPRSCLWVEAATRHGTHRPATTHVDQPPTPRRSTTEPRGCVSTEGELRRHQCQLHMRAWAAAPDLRRVCCRRIGSRAFSTTAATTPSSPWVLLLPAI